MPLNGPSLAALVSVDHLALFPLAIGSIRQNPATGVPPHNPAIAFIDALCEGVATALITLPIRDLGSGTLDVPGNAPPVPVAFPGIPAAQAQLIASAGWVGPQASLAAQVFVGSVLLNVSKISLLVMPPNLLMGTGTGIVSPASTAGLEAAALAALTPALQAAFQASGKFGAGDIPGAPVNPRLQAQLPLYAAAIAKGFSTITATVAYVGTGTVPAAATGIINTGVLQ